MGGVDVEDQEGHEDEAELKVEFEQPQEIVALLVE